jgi:septal ring-binding cell division protein DamX
MNIPIDTHNDGLSDLFFRAADRMRVEGCVNAVANEGMSLALSCVHEALLDHYVQQLLARLRSHAPEHDIEVYFPANTESLISRFNEVLSSQSVREATRQTLEKPRAQIWLVHDAQTLPEHELQLLARLIQNFPGANIRAILMVVGQAPTQQGLSAFGRKLLRWDIETPTDEQAQATLEVARLQGQDQAMAVLLRRMGKRRPPSWLDEEAQAVPAPAPAGAVQRAAASNAEAAATTQPPSASPWRQKLAQLSPQALWRRVQAQAAQPLTPDPSEAATPPSLAERLARLRQRSPLLIAGGGALALSVLLMMWMQPAAFGLKGKGRTAAEAIAEAEASAKQAQAMGAQTTVVSASTGPQAVPAIELPDAAVQGQDWLRNQTPHHFLIQHGALPTFEKAQQWLKPYANLRNAQIVAAYRPGEKQAYFAIVSGPYDSSGPAYERIGRKDLPPNSWVRTVQSLQQQLEPSAKETR